MKLDDPFGRMQDRHQRGYEAMCVALRGSGINTPDAAREIIRQSKKRAQSYIGLAMAVFLLVALLWPEGIAVTISLAFFFTAWLVISARNGQRYIHRFIDEELNENQQKDNGV